MLGAVSLALGGAADARAARAVVHVDYGSEDCRICEPISTLVYRADAGERNAVNAATTSVRSPSAYYNETTIRDDGATIRAGSGCTAVSEHEVRCRHDQRPAFALGDGADTVSVSGTSFNVDGGAGDDVVLAGEGWDVLDGGGGTDELRGGAGNDTLSDSDHRTPRGVNADILDGGEGVDMLTYARRSVPVTIDLRNPSAGQDDEGDSVSGFEQATGGGAADRVVGDDGDNELQGGPGLSSDVLVGNGGRDDLDGGGGNDRLFGGDGDDKLTAGGWSGRAVLHCGAGRDAFGLGPTSIVSEDCEQVLGLVQTLPLTSLDGPILRQLDPQNSDSRRVELRAAAVARFTPSPKLGTLLGRATLSRGNPEGAVRLSRRGRRLLVRYGRLRVAVAFPSEGGDDPAVYAYLTTLRAP